MKSHAVLALSLLLVLVPISVGRTAPVPDGGFSSTSGGLPHTSIAIFGNDDFETQAAGEGWLGNGSSSNPYVIENLNITGQFAAISIKQVSVSFVIRNCELATTTNSSFSLFLNETSNGRIEYCVVRSVNWGIALYHVNNCAFDSNVVVTYVKALTIYDCLNCSFTNNVLQNGGIELWAENDIGYRHEFVNNTVHYRQLGYFWNVTGGIFDASSFAQLIVIGGRNLVFGSGLFWGTPCGVLFVACNMCTLYQSSVYNNTFGIIVTNCSSSTFFSISVTILNNNIFWNEEGMLVSGTLHGRVVANSIYSNLAYGMLLTNAYDSQVYGNWFSHNGFANAVDDGWGNSWDDGVGTGNDSDDYSGTGLYYIQGSAGSIDHYPLGYTTFTNTTVVDGPIHSTGFEMVLWFFLSAVVVGVPVSLMIRSRES